MKRRTKAERRRHPRKPVRESARILLAGPRLPGRLEDHGHWQDCLILNISPGGAKISIDALLELGAAVRLEIGRFGRFAAEIAWLGQREFGLRFTGAPEEMSEVVLGLAVYG
ncbi:MAG: PilZ domain-containing protein [Elusimicrobia bacterium]|nr:PilZ domain-containing protein [Elusimicrobiota bacterium]